MDLLQAYESDSGDDDDEGYAISREGCIRMLSNETEAPQHLFVRSHPHVDGNWAGSCFCRLEKPLSPKRVDAAIQMVVATAKSRGYNGACLRHSKHHISLSRSFFLQASNVSPFVEALTQRLLRNPRPIASFPVTIDMDRPMLLHNDEATRSFLAWPVYGAPLRALVEHCDAVLARYDQPRFYDPPLFHVSIASFVPILRMEVPAMGSGNDGDDDRSDSYDGEEEANSVLIRHVYCQFGTTRLFPIPLHLA